jgi:hypothetical protein
MKKIILKNYFLTDGSEVINNEPVIVKSLNSWLLSKLLHGKELRLRNRFIRFTKDRGTEIEETRKDLVDQFSKKDKDGKPEMIPGPQGERYSIEDQEGFSKAWNEYIKEDYVIRLTPELTESVNFIKETIDKAIEKENFVGRQSMLIEEWSDAFNSLVETTEEEEEEEKAVEK